MILMKNLVIERVGINMQEVNKEIMLIAQEECAEVTQAISKVFRFGIDGEHDGATNRERLEEEVGDLLCMIEMMMEKDILDRGVVAQAKFNKRAKLAKWSNIK
jgi:NTP pyrophosphatase (non-canonical NTP hydrolase)